MQSLVSQKEVNSTNFYNFAKHCFISVVPTSNKILTLRVLLYLKSTFSLKSELSATVLYIHADLSVEVKLTGKAGWKSPCCPHYAFSIDLGRKSDHCKILKCHCIH